MSSLVDHAENELALIGMGAGSDGMGRLMHDNLIQIVRAFAEQRHSGFSAGYAAAMLEKLLRYEPLSPLTGGDDEWEKSGEDIWQNRRCSHVFKEADGRAYDARGKVFLEGSSYYLTSDSRVYVTFPYVPKVEYVDAEDPARPGGEEEGE